LFVPIPHASLLLDAAAAAAGTQQYPGSALYVVATPIGNLADLTLRAIHVLGLVDAVACEDTRHSGALLQHFGLSKPLLAVHEHNEHEACATVLQRLAAGQRVAYVSDAGTPAISDPGSVLVRAAQDAGFRTLPIVGASSAIAAMSVAGDTGKSGFDFIGFLPGKGQEREQALERLAHADRAQVLFEAPHRIASLARGLSLALGEEAGRRLLTVGRELTKQFESVHTLRVSEFPAWLAHDSSRSRGEFALVLHARESRGKRDGAEHTEPTLRALLRALPLKQAVAVAVEITGESKNTLYASALALKQESSARNNPAEEPPEADK
jgi:16S rRNA (cytidine1402-2'-O)-methyltransferase